MSALRLCLKNGICDVYGKKDGEDKPKSILTLHNSRVLESIVELVWGALLDLTGMRFVGG